MSSQRPDSTARVAAALDALSRIQNSAVAFSARQLRALGPPKAPTAPHHHAEVQAQSEAAANSSQSHPYTPYYRLHGCTPTDQASSAPSVATGSSVRSNTIDEYPPEIQALPVIPSFGGSALAVGTMPPASSRTLPVKDDYKNSAVILRTGGKRHGRRRKDFTHYTFKVATLRHPGQDPADPIFSSKIEGSSLRSN
ncbi:hypothetical protein BU15DRAFT_81980 [Melanogaster broomeanus]|nr:hypothetical protein BU15DRAFT_81980 [Melanogaster broomeanus]